MEINSQNVAENRTISLRIDGQTSQQLNVLRAKYPDEFKSNSDIIRKAVDDFYYRETSKDLGIDLTNAIELSAVKGVEKAMAKPIEDMSKAIAGNYLILKTLLSNLIKRLDSGEEIKQFMNNEKLNRGFDDMIFSVINKENKQ